MNSQKIKLFPLENVLPFIHPIDPDSQSYQRMRSAMNKRSFDELMNNPDIQEVLRMLSKV
ncbi:hypothetical protein [Fructobacillus parabroussonetiae]|uniref:Uncharacterized protein n=1 Tax=Fructobacillus parabroussonetiae TaxID=2713174 RepID=A0ABS5QY19_9LACO|nr:hypothetical protein [Fructobacillus parabroussonetiae]MBS9338006.1 hypothetical protein [Fructobacillus parabroussonetiae]